MSTVLHSAATTADYQQDHHDWLQARIKLLRAEQSHDLDREHLIEELEDMGRT